VIFFCKKKNTTFLIIVDFAIERLEVFCVNSMTAQIIVVTKPSELIARFGILRTITTDNAKCFSGVEQLGVPRFFIQGPCIISKSFGRPKIKKYIVFFIL